MELLTLFLLLAAGFYIAKSRDQKRRVSLLSQYLGRQRIEKTMQTLAIAYSRALAETDVMRQTQILNAQNTAELALVDQFNRFAIEFAGTQALATRVSKLHFCIPYADKILPHATFDFRQALTIHARGIALAINNPAGFSPKNRAFHISAELFLMQHTCHWFCRSKTVASTRLLVRHKTSYAQLLNAVLPQTRDAYNALLGQGVQS